MPSVMLPVMGISRMVMNAGSVSFGSVRLIWRMIPNRYRPATTMIGAVATAGMARNNGAMNRLMTKHMATVRAERPVLPPSAKPVALST